jgi:TrpR-related protein YerC/YecD
MNERDAEIWSNPTAKQLIRALRSVKDDESLQNFLRDVMTESEIIEISARLEAARMLASGAKYTEITKSTKLSSRTVARISNWMQNGTGGYAAALKDL